MRHTNPNKTDFAGATLSLEEDEKKLAPNEYYKCPLPHTYPRQEQAFFRNFDAHFSMFKGREDHFSLLKLHEELAWSLRRSESEKHNLKESDLKRISSEAWLKAVKKETGQSIKVVVRK